MAPLISIKQNHFGYLPHRRCIISTCSISKNSQFYHCFQKRNFSDDFFRPHQIIIDCKRQAQCKLKTLCAKRGKIHFCKNRIYVLPQNLHNNNVNIYNRSKRIFFASIEEVHSVRCLYLTHFSRIVLKCFSVEQCIYVFVYILKHFNVLMGQMAQMFYLIQSSRNVIYTLCGICTRKTLCLALCHLKLSSFEIYLVLI